MVAKKAENVVPARKPQARPSTTIPRRRGIRGGLIALVPAAGAMIAALGLIGGQGAASAAPTAPTLSPDSMGQASTTRAPARLRST